MFLESKDIFRDTFGKWEEYLPRKSAFLNVAFMWTKKLTACNASNLIINVQTLWVKSSNQIN